jgi:drug/metabolite transporter (DMT)-like permease
MKVNSNLLILTSLALVAFAANSFLCRWALAGQQIDALSFTLIRLISGAIMLLLLFIMIEKKPLKSLLDLKQGGKPELSDMQNRGGDKQTLLQHLPSLWGPLLLFTYAAGFSYAYLSLETGIGALILFAAVQISMIGINIVKGDRPNPVQWLGIVISFSGFIYLLLPSLSSPSLFGFILMTLAGVAWGIYSLQAKQTNAQNDSALTKTARNFIWSIPFGALLLLMSLALNGTEQIKVQMTGMLLALVSGAVTSGVGYAIWYQVVKQINGTLASVSQLLVPVIATAMGISFLGEKVDSHFIIATIMVLGGVMIVLMKQGRKG